MVILLLRYTQVPFSDQRPCILEYLTFGADKPINVLTGTVSVHSYQVIKCYLSVCMGK